MNIYLLELKRFFTEKKKNIIIGTLLLGILFSGLITILGQTDSEEEIEIKESTEIFENDSNASFFKFYIEKTDGSSFRNEAMMNELFNMDSLHEEVLIDTSIDINKIIDMAEEKKYFDFSPVKIKFDGDSDIYTAIFETGDNKRNIELARFYYNRLVGDYFAVLENHTIFPLIEPELVENNEEEIELAKPGQTKVEKLENIKSVITDIFVGLILAFGISIGILVLKELFGKKLSFIFGYTAEDFDDFIIYDKDFNNEQSIHYFLSVPDNVKKLILIETELDEEDKKLLFNNSNLDVQITNSIEFAPTSEVYDEIIVIVKTNETTRSWYKKQISLLKLHDAQTKIIQLNNIFLSEL